VEWLKPLLGHTVALDTAPLIYFIERHPQYFPSLQPFFDAVHRGEIRIVTSTLTLTEVFVHPLRQQNHELAKRYSSILLNAAHVQVLAVTPDIAMEAARLRASYRYKTPDAIQLATAHSANATFLVTNDVALVSVSKLRIVVLKQVLLQP
jgi:predicted nucleic acid-binding protein